MNDLFKTDTELAEEGKEKGMALATKNATAKYPKWNEEAYQYLELFLDVTLMHEKFLTEDIRRFAYSMGLSQPPSNRSWGSVTRKAMRKGLIEACGYAKTTNPKAHRTPATLFMKTI